MRSSFISLSKLLILKIIKIFKNYYQSIVVMWQQMFSMPVMRTVWRRELEFRILLYWIFIYISYSLYNNIIV